MSAASETSSYSASSGSGSADAGLGEASYATESRGRSPSGSSGGASTPGVSLDGNGCDSAWAASQAANISSRAGTRDGGGTRAANSPRLARMAWCVSLPPASIAACSIQPRCEICAARPRRPESRATAAASQAATCSNLITPRAASSAAMVLSMPSMRVRSSGAGRDAAVTGVSAGAGSAGGGVAVVAGAVDGSTCRDDTTSERASGGSTTVGRETVFRSGRCTCAAMRMAASRTISATKNALTSRSAAWRRALKAAMSSSGATAAAPCAAVLAACGGRAGEDGAITAGPT